MKLWTPEQVPAAERAWFTLANNDPMALRRDQVEGGGIVHKFGRNAAVPNGSWAPVVQVGALNWLTAATTVRVKAGGNAADDGTSSPLGAGAQGVTVQGLNAAGAEVTESLTTAGTSASAVSATEFIRVSRAWTDPVGTYTGNNTGAITIENGAGGTDLIEIAAGEGQTQFCAWTIPAGKVGYLASVVVQADASKAADFRLFTRNNANDVTAPYSAKRLKYFWDGVLGAVTIKAQTPLLTLNAWTDIWVEARGGGAGTEVSADIEILLFDA